MSIAVTAEHDALADSVRGWAEARVTDDVRRQSPRLSRELLAELADQRLLATHLPTDAGGDGYGTVELAIVLEQLGRALLPGAVLSTVIASTLLADVDDAEARAHLPGLAGGDLVGAVGVADGALELSHTDGELLLAGRTRVLCGDQADVLLLPASQAGTTRWVWLRGDEVRTRHLDALDVTRTLADVEVPAGLRVPASRLLEELEPGLVRDVAVSLAAAEGAGIADWCLQTAAEYARTRVQFGRPIGQFQGTKHRVAEILVEVERARAVAWDAARALDTPDGERELTAPAAAVIGLDAAVRCAEEAIQVLGGIGYTWEHDAHLYLRRAVTLRALFAGDLDRWRDRAAVAALEGRRRELRLDLGDGQVREQIRSLVTEAAGLEGPARREHLAEHGLIAPHWPEPWGRGADAREQLIIDEELAAAGVQRPILAIGSWAAPTIIAHGTEEQRQRFVPATLTGEIFWCQLFSEPEAGSDLASLKMRAERVEGGWRLTGQKIWTSLAQMANFGICLARTDPDAPKHHGITYFLVDMASEGIDVRPLREITGEEVFNEVFLDGVFVPDDRVVGEVGDGWRLARTTLANERVGLSDTSTWGRDVRSVLEQAREVGLDRSTGSGAARARLGQLVCDGQTLRLLGFRITLRALTGTDPGPTANVRKLESMRHSQHVAEAGMRLLGADAALAADDGARWGKEYLAARAYTIGGGTTEVLRNVIAERLLGLPRDP